LGIRRGKVKGFVEIRNRFIKTIIKILQLKILKIISAQTESTEKVVFVSKEIFR
jgi:hypothetical protein